MRIKVETGSWASRYINSRALYVDMPENSTIADIIKAIGLPPDITGLAALDGKAVPREYCPSDGDTMKFYPVIVGG